MDSELEKIRAKKLKKLSGTSGSEKKIKIEVNDGNFEREVIERSKKVPVIVDFWATWCAPCLMLGPTLDKLAEEHKGEFVLARLDIDENPINSQNYGIESIPAVKMFKDGGVVSEFVGALPEPAVKQWLDESLG